MPKHLSNFEYPYKDSWDVNKNFMKFEMSGVDNTYANAIRRIIITDIKSVGFKTRPYNESDINVIKNETTMDNQKLTHRIGLVPICIEHPEHFDVDDYQFYINKENNGNDVIEVTSADFQIKQISKNKDLAREEVIKFFPPNKITNEYFFICYLLPDKSGLGSAGGKLHFTAKASVKTARTDAKYNVAHANMTNKIDVTKANKASREYVNEMQQKTGESKSVLEKRFEINEMARHFYTDEYGHPNHFVFEIESYHVIRPMVVLYTAMNILQQKFQNFVTNLKSGNYNEVDIYPSETDMNAFDIKIQHETYTLSTPIQSYGLKYFGGETGSIVFIGHIKPHPLKDEIVIRISLKEGQNTKENVIGIVEKIVQKLMQLNKTIIDEISKNAEIVKYISYNPTESSSSVKSKKSTKLVIDEFESDQSDNDN